MPLQGSHRPAGQPQQGGWAAPHVAGLLAPWLPPPTCSYLHPLPAALPPQGTLLPGLSWGQSLALPLKRREEEVYHTVTLPVLCQTRAAPVPSSSPRLLRTYYVPRTSPSLQMHLLTAASSVHLQLRSEVSPGRQSTCELPSIPGMALGRTHSFHLPSWLLWPQESGRTVCAPLAGVNRTLGTFECLGKRNVHLQDFLQREKEARLCGLSGFRADATGRETGLFLGWEKPVSPHR